MHSSGSKLLARQRQLQLGLARWQQQSQSQSPYSTASGSASTSASTSRITLPARSSRISVEALQLRAHLPSQLQKPAPATLRLASSCSSPSSASTLSHAGILLGRAARQYHSSRTRQLHTTSSPLLREQQPQRNSIKSVDRDAGVAASSSTSTHTGNASSADTPSASRSAASVSSINKAPETPKDVSYGEIRRLFTLARPEKKTLGIALGLLTVSSAVSLSVPFTLGRIIDLFTSGSSSANLPVSIPVAAALLASIFAIGAAANTGRSILMRIAGQRIVQRLRVIAYGNTLKLDMARFDLMGQHMTDKEGKRIGDLPEKGEERIVTYDTTTKPPSSSSSTEVTAETTPEGEGGKQISSRSTQDDAQATNKRSSLSSALSLSSTSETTPDVGVKGVGDVISRLGSDASIVGESLTRELSEGLRALATVVVGVGMMVYISAKLTVLMLCIVPPTAIGAVFYGRYLKKLSRRTQKKVGEMIAVAEERLSSVRTVQAFNAVEPLETKRFSKKANDILDLAKKEAYASGLFFGGAGFSGNITMLALLSYGGKLVSQGEITVGDLSSLMLYTAYVGSSLVGLTTFFSTIMKGLGAAARVFELTDARPSSVQLSVGKKLHSSTPPRPIHFRDVHFSYPSRPDVPILRGVDLSIQRGHSIAIAGGSGSGKSTLVNLLVRYYDPSSGRIDYGEEDIKEYTPESWRERVSVVPQDPALFSQTVAENIAYGKPDATMSEIREAARLANCDFIEDLPLAFDTPVGAKAAQLSGGQRQRLAIARALVRQPSILILDEATSALDAASETLVNQAVKRITSTNSLTTILIAHRLSTLKTADEIVFMADGKVAERGTYEELAREGTEFWNMVRSQMLGTATGTNKGREAESNSKAEEKEAMAV